MPGYAAERRDRAAEQRHVTVEHDQISFAGTVRIDAEVDLPDALDLEDALQAGAAPPAALGSAAPPAARRPQPLGMLARGEQLLPLAATTPQPHADTANDETPAPRATKRPGREIVL